MFKDSDAMQQHQATMAAIQRAKMKAAAGDLDVDDPEASVDDALARIDRDERAAMADAKALETHLLKDAATPYFRERTEARERVFAAAERRATDEIQRLRAAGIACDADAIRDGYMAAVSGAADQAEREVINRQALFQWTEDGALARSEKRLGDKAERIQADANRRRRNAVIMGAVRDFGVTGEQARALVAHISERVTTDPDSAPEGAICVRKGKLHKVVPSFIGDTLTHRELTASERADLVAQARLACGKLL